MDGIIVIIGIVFLIAIAKKLFVLIFSFRETKFGFKGKLVYADQGIRSKTFINKLFGIAAKPDFIFKIGKDSYKAVEYKGRNGKVYNSDIAQTKASVIAARSKYNITHAVVHTDSCSQEIDVNKPSKEIYSEIKELVDMTRDIKSKKVVTTCFPNKFKCRSCSMLSHCKFV